MTDNEKYLLQRINLLEKQLDRLEWRLLKLELRSIEAPTQEPEQPISDKEAEELAKEPNWLNSLLDSINDANKAVELLRSLHQH